MAQFDIEDWGVIDYMQAWERQKVLQQSVQRGERRSTLVFCQHPSVITIGKNGTIDNVSLSSDQVQKRGVQIIANNRGGDVTLHNEGQLVGYPIFQLQDFQPDLHWFLRAIEDCIIQTIAGFGLEGGRVEGLTGVWIEEERKICAIGLHCSRWVTSHGFALNVCNHIEEFEWIIPCGITDKGVTSMQNELQNGYSSSVANNMAYSLQKNIDGARINRKDFFQDVQTLCQEVFRRYF